MRAAHTVHTSGAQAPVQSVDTRKLKAAINTFLPQFCNPDQHDAQEFFVQLLRHITCEVKALSGHERVTVVFLHMRVLHEGAGAFAGAPSSGSAKLG